MEFSLLLVAKLVISLIFLMTAFSKLLGKQPAKDMFIQLGAEPYGRILAGLMELGAVVLLWVPGFARVGAGLGVLTMFGAIGAHVTKLGMNGMFFMALVVLLSSGYALFETQPFMSVTSRAVDIDTTDFTYTDTIVEKIEDTSKKELGEQELTPEQQAIYDEEQASMKEKQQDFAEDMEQAGTSSVLAAGSFNRVDRIHRAEGEVEIIEKNDEVFLVFPENFTTGNGPDLFVLLSQEQDLTSERLDSDKTLNLGPLTSKSGQQIYKISSKEWETYNYAVSIWCRAFDVHFSSAILK